MSNLPEQVRAMAADSPFRFHCHPGIPCFTACCREIELALSPYDVLRLKQALDLSSQDFLERYAIIEFGQDDLYPKIYLAMIDDGRASCPFVGPSGCMVYEDRPAACRTYPVGRGASLGPQGETQEQFVIITEAHCQGFTEDRTQTVIEWQNDQGIADFNRCNDLLLPLLARVRTRSNQRLSDEEASLFIDTLYHLDRFKIRLARNGSAQSGTPDDDESLLIAAVNWLQQQWQTAP